MMWEYPGKSYDGIKAFLVKYVGWDDCYDVLWDLVRDYGTDYPILEIGCWHGGSTIMLACASFVYNRGMVISVDIADFCDVNQIFMLPHFNSMSDRIISGLSVCESGLSDKVVFVNAPSDNAIKIMYNQPISILFVDGAHSYEQCSSDIINYGRLIQLNGIIACHDYQSDTVRRAVDELIKDNEVYCDFRVDVGDGNLAWARKA